MSTRKREGLVHVSQVDPADVDFHLQHFWDLQKVFLMTGVVDY